MLVEESITEVADRLRRLRQDRDWTLEEASRRAGLSKSYLSRVEEGGRQPSIAILLALARAYDVPMSTLFEERRPATDSIVLHRGDGERLEGNGLFYEVMSAAKRPTNLQPIRVTVPADRAGEEELYEHEGEEWLYVLNGRLELILGDHSHHLDAGDTAHFDARMPHRLRSLDGHDVDLILVACAAPRNLLDSYR